MRSVFSKCFVVVLCGILFMGAAFPAPVIPTKGFYVNDYASVLFDEHRDDAFDLSSQLYEQTGTAVVLLTVDSLQELSVQEYAEAIVQGWKIGGPNGEAGVLFLVCTKPSESTIFVGSDLAYLDSYRSTQIERNGSNLSKEIMSTYRAMLLDIYSHNGIQPDEATLAMLEDPEPSESGPFTTGTVIFLAVILLAMGRSLRVSHKYRKKYLHGNVRKLKTHTRSYDEEAQYHTKKYKIDDID